MLSSGSSPLTATRGNVWGFLMFAAAAWLAIGWTLMRLEPTNVAVVAGPVVLFGAVCELLRALAGTRTWWLNAGLAGVFAMTGVLLLVDGDSSLAAPASLVGWYLMVRGAVDVAVGVMTRGTDRVWSLLVTVGVLETGLGFFAASPFARAADLVMVVLGALGVLRAVADLVTALRLREVAGTRKDVLELPAERAAGVAGYTAGRGDAEVTPRSRARHRARPGGSTVTSVSPSASIARDETAGTENFHERVIRTTADLDAMLAHAGITGPRAMAEAPGDQPPADAPVGVEGEMGRPAGGR